MVSLYSGQFFIEKISYQNLTKGYTIYETNKKDLVVWTKDYSATLESETQYFISNLALRKYKDKEQFHTTESSSLERIEAVSTPSSPDTVGSPIDLSAGVRKTDKDSEAYVTTIPSDFFHCPHCSKSIFFYREKVI